MSVDTAMLGEQAALVMDRLAAHTDADEMTHIEAVQVVVVIACTDPAGEEYTRTLLQSSHESHWEQLGLNAVGRECITSAGEDDA